MKLKYLVVFERPPNNCCAYLPDLPGCISTGGPLEEMQQKISEAMAAHVDMMLEYGAPLPEKPMSLEEAMTLPCTSVADDTMKSYSQHGEDVTAVSTTFETLDFEIDPSPEASVS